KSAIPSNVTHLTFGHDFNQDIKSAIPISVTHLTFGYKFNQNIKTAIPSNVTHLTFGHNFNQDIKSAIPTSVTHLFFGYRFNQDITKNNIPINVQYVTSWNKNIKINIPSTIIQETDFKIMVRLLHHQKKLKN